MIVITLLLPSYKMCVLLTDNPYKTTDHTQGYRKIHKNLDNRKIAVITLKVEQGGFT